MENDKKEMQRIEEEKAAEEMFKNVTLGVP